MAKALFGHLGPTADAALAVEVRRLRVRVAELEDEVARLRAANDALAAHVTVADDDLLLRVDEPALA